MSSDRTCDHGEGVCSKRGHRRFVPVDMTGYKPNDLGSYGGKRNPRTKSLETLQEIRDAARFHEDPLVRAIAEISVARRRILAQPELMASWIAADPEEFHPGVMTREVSDAMRKYDRWMEYLRDNPMPG